MKYTPPFFGLHRSPSGRASLACGSSVEGRHVQADVVNHPIQYPPPKGEMQAPYRPSRRMTSPIGQASFLSLLHAEAGPSPSDGRS